MYYNEWSGGLQRPLQPIRLDSWGEVRFLNNRIVGNIFSQLRKEGVSVSRFIDSDHYSDDDKIQLVQLLGYPVQSFLKMDWIDVQTRERVRDLYLSLLDEDLEPGDGCNDPMPIQPLDFDHLGRLFFVPNLIVTVAEARLALDNGLQRAVNGSVGQLIGSYADEEWFQYNQLVGNTVDNLRGLPWTNQARDDQITDAIYNYRREIQLSQRHWESPYDF